MRVQVTQDASVFVPQFAFDVTKTRPVDVAAHMVLLSAFVRSVADTLPPVRSAP
jgi:hypothetical protein